MNTQIWDFDNFSTLKRNQHIKLITVLKNQTINPTWIILKEPCLKEEKKSKNPRHVVLHSVMYLIMSYHCSKNTWEYLLLSSFQEDWSIILMDSLLINRLSLGLSLLWLLLATWLLLALDKSSLSWIKLKDSIQTFMTQCSTSLETEMKVLLNWWKFRPTKESSILSTINFMTLEWCLKI